VKVSSTTSYEPPWCPSRSRALLTVPICPSAGFVGFVLCMITLTDLTASTSQRARPRKHMVLYAQGETRGRERGRDANLSVKTYPVAGYRIPPALAEPPVAPMIVRPSMPHCEQFRASVGRVQFGRRSCFLDGSTQQLAANWESNCAESMMVTLWKPGKRHGSRLPLGRTWLFGSTCTNTTRIRYLYMTLYLLRLISLNTPLQDTST
jgi:hypothetical protein